MKTPLLFLLLLCSAFALASPPAPVSSPAGDLPSIHRRAISHDLFPIAGPHGALLDTQDGRPASGYLNKTVTLTW